MAAVLVVGGSLPTVGPGDSVPVLGVCVPVLGAGGLRKSIICLCWLCVYMYVCIH